MKEQTYQDRHEIQSQLAGHYTEVIHFQDLASNEEKDAHGGHVDDPGGDGHHGLRQTSEKLHQRFALFAHNSQSDSQKHYKRKKMDDFDLQIFRKAIPET